MQMCPGFFSKSLLEISWRFDELNLKTPWYNILISHRIIMLMLHVGKCNMASRRSIVPSLNRWTWISPDCLLFLVALGGRRVREVLAMRQPCGVRQTSLHQQVIVFDLSACCARLCGLLVVYLSLIHI